MNTKRMSSALVLSSALMAVAPIIAPAPFATAAVEAALPSFASLVEATQPAVVTVRVEGRTKSDARRPGMPDMNDPALRDFMERFFGGRPNGHHRKDDKNNNGNAENADTIHFGNSPSMLRFDTLSSIYAMQYDLKRLGMLVQYSRGTGNFTDP